MARSDIPTGFAPVPLTFPKLDYPITPRENLLRLFDGRGPLWMPNAATDIQMFTCPADADRHQPMNEDGKDWFGVQWVFVPEVGAQVVKPGTQVLKTIEGWREHLAFPDLDGYDYRFMTDMFLKNLLPDKLTRVFIGHGFWERMHFLMGFEQAMLDLMVNPEECADFFDACTDFNIRRLDKMLEVYPHGDIVTYSDDFGTQSNTFFSDDTFEALFYKPLKKIVDHAHSRGLRFCLHSCGKVQRYVKYFNDIGIDMWEAQNNNDFRWIRENYGSRLAFQTPPDESVLFDPDSTDDMIRASVRGFVDELAEGRNAMMNFIPANQRLCDLVIPELFSYSREVYAKG